MSNKFINWHKENKKILVMACYGTLVLVVFFVFISFQKEIWNKEINEIGDALSGMIGSLGFIWLIITVLLQNQDLNNQIKELRESKVALASQAKSLESAEIYTALEYIDAKLPSFDGRLAQIKEVINNEIKSFLEKFPSDRRANINFKPDLDICEIWGYFVIEEKLEGIPLVYSDEYVKDTFSYDAYLILETIKRNMGYMINFLDSLTVNARDDLAHILKDHIHSYEQHHSVEWYREWHKILVGIEHPIRRVIAKNNLAPSMIANLFIKGFIDKENLTDS
ncbi:hypothetical protein [Acinetobacter sp. UBA3106]|uniref:hypothetical protein n=1 Tax=Acinetobacter sp. UBA3106 TaxID=1945936 RepID=UPI0025B7DDD0|nr:hypothetical protein [Acinetobacter sp. UBA3106]